MLRECALHLLQTIENTRELVEDTLRTADEVAAAEAEDEFADHFARARAPKVLVTTCYRPTAAMYSFLTELLQAHALSRGSRVRALHPFGASRYAAGPLWLSQPPHPRQGVSSGAERCPCNLSLKSRHGHCPLSCITTGAP
jgi:hypothetical protein